MAKGSMGWVLPVAVVGGIVLLMILMAVGAYNSFVGKDENVAAKWGNVQTAYQRRADLIPNLVETVKGYASHQQETLTQLTQLRAQAAGAQQKIQQAQTPTQIEQGGAETNSAISRLLLIAENYPDLKASQNFLALQDELAGTENRIKFERDNYNEAVRDYRVAVRSFPSNFFAGMFGFNADKHETFAAQPGSENAPKVDF